MFALPRDYAVYCVGMARGGDDVEGRAVNRKAETMVIPEPNDIPKLLLLGQHGFVGSHLAGAGLRTGMHVLGFSLGVDIEQGDRILRSLGTEQVPSVSGDATDSGQLRDVIERYRPDVVVNAVGQIPPSPDPENWLVGYDVNYLTAVATVDAIAALPPEARPYLLWVGTEEEYGVAPAPWQEATEPQPTTAYGISKLLATTIVTGSIHSRILNGCVIRLPLVFGEAQAPSMAMAHLVVAALRGEPIPLLPGDPILRLGYAPDVAEWMIRVASARDATPLPPVVNAPGYKPRSQNEVVVLVDKLFPNGVTANPRPFDWAPEQSPSWTDTSLAEELGLGPILETPLEHALTQTIEWYDRNRWFWEDGNSN